MRSEIDVALAMRDVRVVDQFVRNLELFEKSDVRLARDARGQAVRLHAEADMFICRLRLGEQWMNLWIPPGSHPANIQALWRAAVETLCRVSEG